MMPEGKRKHFEKDIRQVKICNNAEIIPHAQPHNPEQLKYIQMVETLVIENIKKPTCKCHQYQYQCEPDY